MLLSCFGGARSIVVMDQILMAIYTIRVTYVEVMGSQDKQQKPWLLSKLIKC